MTDIDASIVKESNLSMPTPEFHVFPKESPRANWWSEDYDRDCRPREGIGWYIYVANGEFGNANATIPAAVLAKAARIAELRRELEREESELTSEMARVFAFDAPDSRTQSEK